MGCTALNNLLLLDKFESHAKSYVLTNYRFPSPLDEELIGVLKTKEQSCTTR